METFNLSAAFIAGMLSFLSPCILPLLPGYLSFLTGYTLDEIGGTGQKNYKYRALTGGFGFGLGFSVVFIALGAAASTVGRFLLSYQHIFSVVFGIVVIILGLHMLGVFRIKFLYNEKKVRVAAKKKPRFRLLQAFLIGFAFAFGWTPCIGPILGGILTLAARQESVSQGVYLLSAYSLGLWIPFMAAALFTVPVLGFLGRYPKIAHRAEQAAGVLLIVMGLLLITGYMTYITAILG